ncbi:PREDICTED: acyl-coenzyme A thioesterase THEM4-like [Gekko japonicus]|uniref:Acyl-coenzyme A thioesterase THEM4 n=1 Tax=Gekko japonicus TaxID=146911 RepID=A0ABM1LH45_GEKJA|nr:PREDICTED: acyl-coenzyme A thioesterase THEM4-like [Gekko japonicus]
MLRRGGRHLVKCLDSWVGSGSGPRAAASKGVSLHPTYMSFSRTTVRPLPSSKLKDYALPNASWSEDMLDQFNKFMAMSEDGTWRRIPSHRSVEESAPEYMKEKLEEEQKKRDTRYFCRSIDSEGLGFEYVMFFNSSQKRMVGIFQLGPYLEGPPGIVHGGSIATILDATLSLCAFIATDAVLTANLSINFKSPVQLGSVVLVDSKVDRMEGRKAFLSGPVLSVDGQTLHAEGTGSFFFAAVLNSDTATEFQQACLGAAASFYVTLPSPLNEPQTFA